MRQKDYQKYRLNKLVELGKFSITLLSICFLIVRTPDQASQLVTTAGAFILGGSKLKSKVGL